MRSKFTEYNGEIKIGFKLSDGSKLQYMFPKSASVRVCSYLWI